MKRHISLLQLSREHHLALKLARIARIAVETGQAQAIDDAAKRICQLFASELEPHFLAEERDVLPALAAAGGGALTDRTLAEHAALRELNQQLASPDSETLARFASLLHDHVRFEERELFELAQALLHTPP
ncbi:MAG: hemerythrin domain-containing protein [Dechloromonas sp.]|nr:hemerythrin domain-containing protein [Dechloromonas sp.]